MRVREMPRRREEEAEKGGSALLQLLILKAPLLCHWLSQRLSRTAAAQEAKPKMVEHKVHSQELLEQPRCVAAIRLRHNEQDQRE